MILSASWVVPVSSPPISKGAVVLNGGRIQDVGPSAEVLGRYPDREVRDLRGAALLPGLVNVHSHLELTLLRGYLENLGFWDWIRRLTRTKYELLTREDLGVSALAGACEAIRSGVTTLGDAMDLGVSLDALSASGLRGVLYQEVFSPRPEEAEERLAELQAKQADLEERIESASAGPHDCADDRSTRIQLGVSPHAPYSVSGTLFRKVRQWAASRGLPVCIHLAESEDESLLLEEGTGPMAEALRSRGVRWSAPGCSPVQYLHRLEILAPGTLLVHCVRLRASDLPILKQTGVSIAHCPKSNWKLGHGSMDLKQVVQAGVPLGLGSDSVASNNTMDLFEEMRFSLFNPSWFSRRDGPLAAGGARKIFGAGKALRLATLGGAEALGLSASIGSLEPGKQADLIGVDLAGIHTLPVFSPVTAIVHSARASDVILTMVGGEVLFEKGTVTSLDEADLKKRMGRISQKLKPVGPA